MPANNAFTGFTTTGQNSSSPSEYNSSGAADLPTIQKNFGYSFWTNSSKNATIHFPVVGNRVNYTGQLGNIGIGAFYRSAVPYSYYDGCILYIFLGSVVYPLYRNDRSYGFAVRPVSE